MRLKKLYYSLIFFIFIKTTPVLAKHYVLYEENVIKEEIRSMNKSAFLITISSAIIIYFLYNFFYKRKRV